MGGGPASGEFIVCGVVVASVMLPLHSTGTAWPSRASTCGRRLCPACRAWAAAETKKEASFHWPPIQVQSTGRISAQHHCCNGKSIQCPSNIITLSGHLLLWASALFNCPCSSHYALSTPSCKSTLPIVIIFSQKFPSDRFYISSVLLCSFSSL